MAIAELARQEWADGYRRLESEREEPARYRVLLAQAGAIADELRRRVGSVFTLAELADEYSGADRWVAEALAALPVERALSGGRERRDRRRVPPLRARRARLHALSTPAARRRDGRPRRRRTGSARCSGRSAWS